MTTTVLPLATGTWTSDLAHSSVEFTVRHLGLTKVRGRFNQFDASIVVGDSLEASTVTAEIAMSSVDTNNTDRDAHLLSTDFFGVDANPTMTFRSTGISGAGDDWTLVGDLTINGITKSVELDVEFYGLATDPYGNAKAGFAGETTISRKDFGIEFNAPLETGGVLLADKVAIQLELQFVAAG
ncbi:MAG: YceI family protein [Acidimicrobiales bacterium]